MSETYLDGLLDELLTAEPQEEWSDVLRRARRARRRWMALAAVAGALVVAPAAWAAVDAFEGTACTAGRPATLRCAHRHASTRRTASSRTFPAPTRARRTASSNAMPRATACSTSGRHPSPTARGKCWFVGWESEHERRPRGRIRLLQLQRRTTPADRSADATARQAIRPTRVLVGSVSATQTTRPWTSRSRTASTTTLSSRRARSSSARFRPGHELASIISASTRTATSSRPTPSD